MRKKLLLFILLFFMLALAGLAGCGAPAKTVAVKETQVVIKETKVIVATELPLPTTVSKPTGLPTATPLPTPVIEGRLVEFEFPAEMRLGDSDVVRLALVLHREGYIVKAEFQEHTVESQPVRVEFKAGYALNALARLDGVGFEIAPAGDRSIFLSEGETAVWRWTLRPQQGGRQRLSVQLMLRWEPEDGNMGITREVVAFARGFEVQVSSILGMTRDGAMTAGFIGLAVGAGLSVGAALLHPRRRARLRTLLPNLALTIEPHPGVRIQPEEELLLRALFGRYSRLVVEREFLSGYSGARTFLALPVKADGRSDAATIIKIGSRRAIEGEYENYETYVKDTLPPITARIQHAPVTVTGSDRAAVQYTFLAAPGRLPVSLRQALVEKPDPALLRRLFDTFAPNWWRQRKPYAFRAAQEYDSLLPAHLALEPLSGAVNPVMTLDAYTSPAGVDLNAGDVVLVRAFPQVELRADGQSYSLLGRAQPGQPPLRLRWHSLTLPAGTLARVTATRMTLLQGWTAGLECFDLPDPLVSLPQWLNASVRGTVSILHGDLNLENVLVGTGDLVWLIDFASTREGHTLFDFAHLYAEVIAHVLGARKDTPQEFLTRLMANADPLLAEIEAMADRCLFNPAQAGEKGLAFCLGCLGAVKYPNLDGRAKHRLLLAAAYQGLGASAYLAV